MFRSLFLIAIVSLLSGCSSGTWGWYVVDPSTPAGQRNLWFLIDGLYYTIALSVTAILISIFLGLIVALPGLARQRPPRMFNRVYVELVRAVPILVLILWVYYGLPQVADISISVFWAGVLALAIRTVPSRRRFFAQAFSRLIGVSMKLRIQFRLPMPTRCVM